MTFLPSVLRVVCSCPSSPREQEQEQEPIEAPHVTREGAKWGWCLLRIYHDISGYVPK